MDIPKLYVGEIVRLKKMHPCGCDKFKILRVGSEIRLVCELCKRDMTLDRLKLEKAIKK